MSQMTDQRPTVGENGCVLSFKIGENIFHHQRGSQQFRMFAELHARELDISGEFQLMANNVQFRVVDESVSSIAASGGKGKSLKCITCLILLFASPVHTPPNIIPKKNTARTCTGWMEECVVCSFFYCSLEHFSYEKVQMGRARRKDEERMGWQRHVNECVLESSDAAQQQRAAEEKFQILIARRHEEEKKTFFHGGGKRQPANDEREERHRPALLLCCVCYATRKERSRESAKRTKFSVVVDVDSEGNLENVRVLRSFLFWPTTSAVFFFILQLFLLLFLPTSLYAISVLQDILNNSDTIRIALLGKKNSHFAFTFWCFLDISHQKF